MTLLARLRRPGFFRPLIGWAFLVWCAGMGVRFGLWLAGVLDPAVPAWVLAIPRPAGVEGFLPVGALVSLSHLLANGVFDPTHPAGLTLLLTFIGMSALARRSFCSFVCPVGTVSESLWKGGKRLFGRALGAPWRVWKWLDLPLRSLKYLLLGFFVWLVFVSMSPEMVANVVDSPYEKVADIMMWRFFARISPLALGVFLLLGVLSLLIQNFWCRYLCPYGALVGLAGMLSPWKIRREEAACTECGACSRACPSWLPVMEKKVVRSAECTGCLTCVDHCPAPGALRMALPALSLPAVSPPNPSKGRSPRDLPWWVYPAVVLALFALGVGAGMATGHWQSSLSPEEIRRALAEGTLLR